MPLRRLTRREFNNTLRDLVGVTSNPADAFPLDIDGSFMFHRAGVVSTLDASVLFDTLQPGELLEWPADTLLARLFQEDAPRLLGDRPLRFACSCSRERVAAMLESLGPEEARAAVIDGAARIRCEFCGQDYQFSGDEVEALFHRPDDGIRTPGTLQ